MARAAPELELEHSRLRVSIQIEAEMPEGAPEHVHRRVSESAQV